MQVDCQVSDFSRYFVRANYSAFENYEHNLTYMVPDVALTECFYKNDNYAYMNVWRLTPRCIYLVHNPVALMFYNTQYYPTILSHKGFTVSDISFPQTFWTENIVQCHSVADTDILSYDYPLSVCKYVKAKVTQTCSTVPLTAAQNNSNCENIIVPTFQKLTHVSRFARLQGKEALIIYYEKPENCQNMTDHISLIHAEKYDEHTSKRLKITWKQKFSRIWHIRFQSPSSHIMKYVPMTIEVKRNGKEILSNRSDCDIHIKTVPVLAKESIITHNSEIHLPLKQWDMFGPREISLSLKNGVDLKIYLDQLYYNKTWEDMKEECERKSHYDTSGVLIHFDLPYFSTHTETRMALKALYLLHERMQIRKYPFLFFYGIRKINTTVSTSYFCRSLSTIGLSLACLMRNTMTLTKFVSGRLPLYIEIKIILVKVKLKGIGVLFDEVLLRTASSVSLFYK